MAREFQPDAVEIERRSTPGGARWTLYIVIALIIAGVTWASLSKVDRIVIAEGEVVPVSTPIVVQAAEPSQVQQVLVKFGDIVTPGQILAVLDSSYSQSELEKLEQDINAIKAEIYRLKLEQTGQETFALPESPSLEMMRQEALFKIRRAAFEANEAELRFEISRNEASIATNEGMILLNKERKKLLDEEVALTERLVEKAAETKSALMSARNALLQCEIQIGELELKRKELQASKEGVTKKLDAFLSDWDKQVIEKLVEAEKKRNETEAQIRKAQRSIELATLKVPEDLPHSEYMVTQAAERSEGASVLQQGEAAFKLIPRIENANDLEVEVRIPGKDIGQDFSGDVKIKFNAFPYQKFGYANGTVRRISEASIDNQEEQDPSRAEAMRRQSPEAAAFRARIEFEDNWRDKMQFDEPPKFFPGMTVTAEIDVGNRRVIDYFLYPLFRNLDRSIREP